MTATVDVGELFRTRQGLFMAWAHRVAGNRHTAEDIVSEAMAKAWEIKGRWEDRGREPHAWVRSIIRFTALRAVGNVHARRTQPSGLEFCADRSSIAEGPSPDALETAVVRSVAVASALDQLPLQQGRIVRLRFWEDLTFAEIGARLGVHPSTAQIQAMKAYAKLRVLLADWKPAP